MRMLVSILPDRTYPFKGRTVAARALGKLALPQLELLSETLIRDEIAHAYRGVWRWSLLERETPTPGLDWRTACSKPAKCRRSPLWPTHCTASACSGHVAPTTQWRRFI